MDMQPLDGLGDEPDSIVSSMRAIRNSGLFEPEWYLVRNPDVRIANVDPIQHFLETGFHEGRNPAALFDCDWYLEQYPDIGLAGANPLVHYLRYGGREGRSPHVLFQASWYLASQPVIRSGWTPLAAYLNSPAIENQNPHPMFDARWYLETYQDVARSGVNPLRHFVEAGGLEGRSPHPLFDSRWYIDTYLSDRAGQCNPLAHFIRTGIAEGHDPHPNFDMAYYASRYPDVTASGLDPFTHYLAIGQKQGRVTEVTRIALFAPVPRPEFEPPAGPPWAASFDAILRDRLQILDTLDVSVPPELGGVTFSLLLVPYGGPPRISRLMQALQEQVFADYEVLILDRRHDQRVSSMLKAAAVLDPRIAVHTQDMAEASESGLSRLLGAARGRYVIALESDAVLYPDSLAYLAGPLRQGRPSVIFGDEQTLGLNDRPSALQWNQQFSIAAAMTALPARHFIAVDAELARTSQLFEGEATGGRNAWDRWLRLLGRNLTVIHLPVVLHGSSGGTVVQPGADRPR